MSTFMIPVNMLFNGVLMQAGYLQLSPTTFQSPSGLLHQCAKPADMEDLVFFAAKNAIIPPSEPISLVEAKQVLASLKQEFHQDWSDEQRERISAICEEVAVERDLDDTEKRAVIDA